MKESNLEKRKRNILRTANKYHEQIVLLTLIPSILMFLSFDCIVLIGNPFIFKAITRTSFLNMQRLVDHYCILMLWLMCLILVISFTVSFFISRNIVGPFGRMMFELDEIIAGRSKKIITTRPKDHLSRDILKRVNFLVKFYVVKTHEK